MLRGPITRRRQNQRRYHLHLKKVEGQDCEFCKFGSGSSQVRETFHYFRLVENIFGYDIWDGLGVSEHLMLVPKRHVTGLHKFTKNESEEYMKLTAHFEELGYSVYSRSTANISKSVAHQHTHLLRLDDKHKKALLFIRKPHLVVYF